ncbi:MAG: DUF1501 domain-containing protein [Planctomycetes bacterium]|nr:DUF1501 domain-containing protein [Planctomycetota bacterium]
MITRPVCRGYRGEEISRRSFISSSVIAGVGGLTLPQVLRQRAEAATAGRAVKDTAVIQIWLGGGPSHFETYDPKPDAPAEYRGPFGVIPTKLPGV